MNNSGIVIVLAICWLISWNRKEVNWKNRLVFKSKIGGVFVSIMSALLVSLASLF